eukprot:NODE_5701_length_622_cov_321.931313_g5537_i0.p2 GENE.NODE_5701_length_622_cov_321.931313_g5537_i0~~NODE_5701_length_622_cov_321.931313_g5537_i0.p2  ORF type:complete len:122 (-),score=35.93 NODE_5701_length_622_cov_321.931313_g5537_i0:196-561(-)
MTDFNAVGKAFVQHYYNTFDTNRQALSALYRDSSLMTFEGAQLQGQANIIQKLMSLTFRSVKHETQTIDCQPSQNNGILVMVSGMLKTDEDQPQKFSQLFHLMQEGANFWVSNDMFRLNYG